MPQHDHERREEYGYRGWMDEKEVQMVWMMLERQQCGIRGRHSDNKHAWGHGTEDLHKQPLRRYLVDTMTKGRRAHVHTYTPASDEWYPRRGK